MIWDVPGVVPGSGPGEVDKFLVVWILVRAVW